MVEVAGSLGLSLPDQLKVWGSDDDFKEFKKDYDENWEDTQPELNSDQTAAYL